MLEGGSHIRGVCIEEIFIRAQIGAAADVEHGAIAVGRQAIGGQYVLGLMQGVDREQGAIRQVELQGAVVGAVVVVVVVDLVFDIGVGHHETAEHRALLVECPAHVRFQIVPVPAAIARRDRALELVGRALEHHVDDAPQLAGAVEQAGGATHDLHPIHRGQRRQGAELALHRRWQAVEVHLIVFVAAREDGGAAAVVDHGAQTRRVLGQIVHGDEVALLYVVIGQHCDRLGNVFQGRRGLGPDGGRVDAVTPGLLRRRHPVERVAIDHQGFVRSNVLFCCQRRRGDCDGQGGRDGQSQRARRFILEDNHRKSDPQTEMIIIFI